MPDWKSLLRRRLPQLSADAAADDDIVEELTAHLQDRYEELRASGLSEQEAITSTLDDVRASDRFEPIRRTRRPRVVPVPEGPHPRGPIGDMWRDVRYGARLLWRTPALTGIVVATLALGIAANTTAFTVINTLLLNPLPVER